MRKGFSEFYQEWKGKVQGTYARRTEELFLTSDRDRSGFDILPDFIAEHGEEWAVDYATVFEQYTGIVTRLDLLGLTKFRMIFDRHVMNLSRTQFDEAFILSSDERSLFLVHNRIPPSRVCSAMTKAKNVAVDTIIAHSGGRFSHHEMALVSAITTLYMIEVNHILRVYRLFERGITPEECHYEFREPTADRLPEGYTPPTTNAQMTLPEVSSQGSIQLF